MSIKQVHSKKEKEEQNEYEFIKIYYQEFKQFQLNFFNKFKFSNQQKNINNLSIKVVRKLFHFKEKGKRVLQTQQYAL
ncbi:unnamed protein product [Paramecium pentaurelia]|uniref:Uncharacterized protein n=1 Tax=Paramecium pentaurelia TaxID=43138 RepID=A0A8S1YJU9_9CILI|nr:unnamed protein product [Paramecium pentaurelia]